MRFIKGALILLLVFGTLVLIAALGGIYWWRGANEAPNSDPTEVRFVITKGSSAETIGKNLEGQGLIKSAFAFKIYLQSKSLIAKIPPGEFDIPGNLKMGEVVLLLMQGPSEVWVTIPEGLRREEVADIVAESFGYEGLDREAYVDEFLDASERMEGYLFPDSYLFDPDVSAPQVVQRLRSTFDSKFNLTNSSSLSLDEVVTLASIIEREAGNGDERAIVAGIYLNRINAGWSLDADATLQYAVGNVQCSGSLRGCDWWPRPVTVSMKESNSPYNTYRFAGLPPGPICNPGLSALKAAADPEESNYWFYLHDADGVIHYARSLQEHNLNISQYLR